MPGDLSLRCFKRESSVPGFVIRTVAPAGKRMSTIVRGIDDSKLGNEPHQFIHADARQPIILSGYAVIGRVGQIKSVNQLIIFVGDAVEHAMSSLNILRWNDPVSIE